MNEETIIDFINCSEDECIEFSKKVVNGEIENSKIVEMFNYYQRKKNYKEVDAIKLIKNLSLTQYYIPTERTDYQTPCNRTLLKVARFIEGDGSLNFKILKALCLSQFSEDEKSFIENVNEEILSLIRGRFDTIVGDDINESKHIKSVFDYIVKTDGKHYDFYYE